jgi:hypothetical protein
MRKSIPDWSELILRTPDPAMTPRFLSHVNVLLT